MLAAILLGCWQVDASDAKAMAEYGNVKMNFYKDGRLVYEIDTGKNRQIMNLTFRVEGQELITDQPSAPREERTPVRIGADGRLVLGNGESAAHYVRCLKEESLSPWRN